LKYGGIPGNLHLFGTLVQQNLIYWEPMNKGDQFSRLLHGGRISLNIGIVGAITFPLGMIIGGGWLRRLD